MHHRKVPPPPPPDSSSAIRLIPFKTVVLPAKALPKKLRQLVNIGGLGVKKPRHLGTLHLQGLSLGHQRCGIGIEGALLLLVAGSCSLGSNPGDVRKDAELLASDSTLKKIQLAHNPDILKPSPTLVPEPGPEPNQP